MCFAIGEFSIGISSGFTHDPNNLEDKITQYNTALEVFREGSSGGTTSQMNIPYSFSGGINLKYQFNYILFRFGCHFTKPSSTIRGSVTTASDEKNKIDIKTYQMGFPVTIGLSMPLNKWTSFYLGAGLTYHYAFLEITQSNPAVTSSVFNNMNLSTNRKNSYSGIFPGYHIILGIEVPVHSRLTISSEWIHQEGRSHSLSNNGVDAAGNDISAPRNIINIKGDFFIIGVNYFISI
ncbi:MAG: outer membrane beta-barrel protein [Spirochaetota bacterium]|nr:outer membrane beta-barrel protein [Spirochaetota bacterium]